MELYRKIKKYFEEHLTATFVLILAMSVFVIAIIFQTYLKREYFQYLIEQSYATENAMLQSVQKNISNSIKDHINFGSEMAVSSELYEKVISGRDEAGYNALYNTLSDYGYIKSTVSVAIVNEDGLLCLYDRYKRDGGAIWNRENQNIIDQFDKEMILNNTRMERPRYIVFTDPSVHPEDPELHLFHVVYPMIGASSGLNKVKNALVISYNMGVFEEFLNTVEVSRVKYTQSYISDRTGTILYHNDKNLIGRKEAELVQDENIHVLSSSLGYFGWNINILMDENKMLEHVDQIYNKGFLIYLIILSAYIAIILMLVRLLMKPVKKISEAIKTVKHGNLHSQIEIKGTHEIWQLADEYNKMVRTLEEKNKAIEQQYQETLISIERQHQAERDALESQINAHFICNTLGTINYEAIEAGNRQVSMLIKKLSNILRYTFDQKKQEVYLSQEIAWIDQYIYLQKIRYGEMFDYQIEFEEQYGYWPCCKLMFQPFVENSIMHGFEGRHEGGIILISVNEDKDRLKIVISDNGSGMPLETAKIINDILITKGNGPVMEREKVGIGILNVVTRMRMYYGENLDISMETEVGKGTKFTFFIPIPQSMCEEEKELC